MNIRLEPQTPAPDRSDHSGPHADRGERDRGQGTGRGTPHPMGVGRSGSSVPVALAGPWALTSLPAGIAGNGPCRTPGSQTVIWALSDGANGSTVK